MRSKRFIFSVLTGITLITVVRGQDMPREIMAGQAGAYMQFSVFKTTSLKQTGIFNTSSYTLYYKSSSKNEAMSQIYALYSLSKFIKIGLGAFYATKPGLKPSLTMQFFRSNKTSSLVVAPRVDLNCKPTGDLMVAFEFKSIVLQSYQFYYRVQIMYNTDFRVHNRSYQYARLGMQHKTAQYGLAINVDWFGKDYSNGLNYGVFYRVSY